MNTSLDHLPDYKQEQLKKIAATIVKAVDPEQVILFGSHATGRWVEHRYSEGGITYEYISDYDILVITKSGEHRKDYEIQDIIENRCIYKTSVTVKYLLLSISFFMLSCKGEVSPEEVAEKYCDCMESNIVNESDYLLARRKCDSQFINKYEYFRRFKTEMSLKEYHALTEGKMDSTRNFVIRFMDYMNDNCKYGGW